MNPILKSIQLSMLAAVVTSAGETNEIGQIGVMLSTSSNFPTVVLVFPSSPAAKDGRLKPGSKILAVSKDGNDTGFVSTMGISVKDLKSFITGEPDSEVSVRATVKNEKENEVEEVVRLTRASVLTWRLPNGRIASAFFDPDLSWSLLNLDSAATARLRRVPFSTWSQITNGMASNDVVNAIGNPLHVEENAGKSRWQYGWLFHYKVNAVKEEVYGPDTTELYIANGCVSQTFGIKQPPGDRMEILSRPQ